MTKAHANLFTGKAGEHAVASQLLIRNWHVAFPAVDVGHDLLISDHEFTQLRRIQVKTCRATEQRRSYVGRFRIRLDQLAAPATPEILYVFAVFRNEHWSDFVVARRDHVYSEYDLHNVASAYRDAVTFRLVFDGTTVTCGQRDWTAYRNNWPAH